MRPFYLYGPDEVRGELVPVVINPRCCVVRRSNLAPGERACAYRYLQSIEDVASAILRGREQPPTGAVNIASGVPRHGVREICVKNRRRAQSCRFTQKSYALPTRLPEPIYLLSPVITQASREGHRAGTALYARRGIASNDRLVEELLTRRTFVADDGETDPWHECLDAD